VSIVTDTTDTTTVGSTDADSEPERTCDYPGCEESTAVQDVFRDHFCARDHLAAARNEWEPDELTPFFVEYDGTWGTFRAPSQEQADKQWRAAVRARRKS
jgi:hypothetical protein